MEEALNSAEKDPDVGCIIITVPELFRIRYGSRALQIVYGVIFILVYIFYLVAQYKGFGMVASALFDIPRA